MSLGKDFANLFRRAECHLILVQFCFLKENTGVASPPGYLGLSLSGPRPRDVVWSWEPVLGLHVGDEMGQVFVKK